MTCIVNLYKEKYDVYIGRVGKGKDGYFGNPITIGRSICIVCNLTHIKPGSTLECFEKLFDVRIKHDNEYRARIELLAGKTLGCFCKPKPCHGDIIVKWLNGQKETS